MQGIDAGSLLQIGNGRVYVVEQVTSETTLTLRDPIEEATASGLAYAISSWYPIRANDPYETGLAYAIAGNRMLRITDDGKVAFSNLDVLSARRKPHAWTATDYHDFPNGVEPLDLRSIGDAAVVFTTGGIWTIQGLSYPLTDDFGNAQHRLDNVNQDIAIWGRGGSCTSWLNTLIVPGQDAIYVFDIVSGVTQLSTAIENRYRSYVTRGYQPGQPTVYRNHLILPVLDASGGWRDTLICRLDRPGDARGQVAYPWTRADGNGAHIAGVVVRREPGIAPQLLAVEDPRGGQSIPAESRGIRILNLDSWFTPSSAFAEDENSMTPHILTVITRDFVPGPLNLTRVRRVRAHYDLSSDDERASLLLDTAEPGLPLSGTLWGQFNWGQANWNSGTASEFSEVQGEAPLTTEREPYVWPVNKRVRQFRLRLRSSGPCAKLTLQHLEVIVAPSAQTRR